MARVSHTVAFVGFACSFVLGLYMPGRSCARRASCSSFSK
jgi:hypothetical protein